MAMNRLLARDKLMNQSAVNTCSVFTGEIGAAKAGAIVRRTEQLTRKTPIFRLRFMEVHFTPEQEARLAQIAQTTGTGPEELVKDAVLRLLEQDARFRAAVQEGIAQADRGEFIEEDEMNSRFEQMLRL